MVQPELLRHRVHGIHVRAWLEGGSSELALHDACSILSILRAAVCTRLVAAIEASIRVCLLSELTPEALELLNAGALRRKANDIIAWTHDFDFRGHPRQLPLSSVAMATMHLQQAEGSRFQAVHHIRSTCGDIYRTPSAKSRVFAGPCAAMRRSDVWLTIARRQHLPSAAAGRWRDPRTRGSPAGHRHGSR